MPSADSTLQASDKERLAQGQRAYDAGNFARVAELTRELSRSSDSDVATAASKLAARVSVDGVSLGVLGLALLLFLLTVKAYAF